MAGWCAGLTEPEGDQDVDMDGYFDGMYTILADSDDMVTVTAAVKDGKGQPLNAGASGSSVAFQVNYPDGSSLIPGRVSYPHHREAEQGE